MTTEEFYLQTAISALQGLQESGEEISIAADLLPSKAALMAFRIADAMMEELLKRDIQIVTSPQSPNYHEIIFNDITPKKK